MNIRLDKVHFFTIASILLSIPTLVVLVKFVSLRESSTYNKSLAENLQYTNTSQVAQAVGASEIIYGIPNNSTYKQQDLLITSPASGVYEIKRSNNRFPCEPGTKDCEPDRYEIRFSKTIGRIYGLGMQPAVNEVEVNDILDTSFGFGHCYAKRDDGTILNAFKGGACRLRTPILFLPQENLIIGYLQPEIKKLRITRDGQYGCPQGHTCIVMKKHETYPEGQPAEFFIIKGTSPSDTYSKYYNYLKNAKGMFFKKPNYRSFGINWETYFELGCNPNKTAVFDAITKYENKKIKLSSVTIGSGYWNTESAAGCGSTFDSLKEQIDSLQANVSRFGGKAGLNDLFNNLLSKDIYPMIGMRHRIQPGDTNDINVAKISSMYESKGYPTSQKNFLFSADPKDPSTRVKVFEDENNTSIYHYLLDTQDPISNRTWIELTREAYGDFKGIKHDDMDIHDLRTFSSWPKASPKPVIEPNKIRNLKDDMSSAFLKNYYDYYGPNFLISSNNDWFSLSTDWEEMDWLGGSAMPFPPTFKGYFFKFYTDLALTRILSGYVNTVNYSVTTLPPQTNVTDPQRANEIVRATQLSIFHPINKTSFGFWHIKRRDGSDDTRKQEVMTWYLKFRERLQQYAYDNMMRWYETGVPQLMQPLFFRFPNDLEVYRQYTYLPNETDRDNPRNEFMFGNALLVRPVYSEGTPIKIYIPEGKWKPIISSSKTKGKIYSKGYIDYHLPNLDSDSEPISEILDYPVFLKEGEILIIGDPANPTNLLAYVFLDSKYKTERYHHYPQNKESPPIILQAIKEENGKIYLQNLNNNKKVEMSNDIYGKGFKVAEIKSIL